MTLGLDKYLIAFIIFSVIMVGGIIVMSDFNNKYPTANVNVNLTSAEEQEFQNILDDYEDLTVDMQNKTLAINTGGSTTLDAINQLINGAYKAIRLIGTSFMTIPRVLGLLAVKLGINPIFVNAATAGLIILVIIALIYLFMKVIA